MSRRMFHETGRYAFVNAEIATAEEDGRLCVDVWACVDAAGAGCPPREAAIAPLKPRWSACLSNGGTAVRLDLVDVNGVAADPSAVAAVARVAFRVRFRLKGRGTALYAFWLSARPTGESGGYLGCGSRRGGLVDRPSERTS